jgi:hypothetical protein
MSMKSFYSKFRIALMTLAIGLASVWFFKGMNEGFFDVSVDLPKVQSENVLIVFPKTKKQMPCCLSYESYERGWLSGESEKPLKPKNFK